MPDNPGAWLTVTARNCALDRIRRARTLQRKTELLDRPEPVHDAIDETGPIRDERLELIFTCCHPALALDAQVALTLRAVGGLTTEEIAAAFLVAPETMKRRLSRAKAKIKGARIPFAVPEDHLLPNRLAAVLAVVYLIFNEGYGGREELASEAIRLGELLRELMPDEPEAHALSALMLLHHARAAARYRDGELVLLPDQDRGLWDQEQIAAGRRALERAIALRGNGVYVLQAAIASLQLEDPVDWQEVAVLHGRLAELTRSPIVELNRAVAVAEAGDAEAALAIADRLDLESYPYLHATRADLLRRLGRREEALTAYRRALDLTRAGAERAFLEGRIADL